MNTSATIVTKPGFLTITHQENPSYIYFNWENFQISLDDCVDAFSKAEKAISKLGVFHIVSDITKVKQELKPEVAKWWGEVCMPSLSKCGVKLIVNVLPSSALDQHDTGKSRIEVVNNIAVQKAGSVKNAESLVETFQSTTPT